MNIDTLSSLSGPAALTSMTGKPSRLHEAAQQFESLVIGEMLRTQREADSEGWLGSGDESGQDSGADSATDLAESQLANALAAGGGLGLARMIEKTMGQADSTSDSPRASSSLSVR